jgi:hypothetical protein
MGAVEVFCGIDEARQHIVRRSRPSVFVFIHLRSNARNLRPPTALRSFRAGERARYVAFLTSPKHAIFTRRQQLQVINRQSCRRLCDDNFPHKDVSSPKRLNAYSRLGAYTLLSPRFAGADTATSYDFLNLFRPRHRTHCSGVHDL